MTVVNWPAIEGALATVWVMFLILGLVAWSINLGLRRYRTRVKGRIAKLEETIVTPDNVSESHISRLSDLPTEELLRRARLTDGDRAAWGDWTRDMLLAFHRNRNGGCDKITTKGE